MSTTPATDPIVPPTGGGAPSGAGRGGALLGRVRGLELQEYALAFVVVALFIAGAIAKPDTFPTWDNVRNMLTQASVVGVLAIGMTFVIATAGHQLSGGPVEAGARAVRGVLPLEDEGLTVVLLPPPHGPAPGL